MILRTVATLAVSALMTGCSFAGGVFGARGSYEEPVYQVMEEVTDRIEIREYGERLAAEVTVDTTEDNEDQNNAFKILFDYISGENETRQKVAMTVPVETERKSESEEIAMTVPVEMAGTDASRMRMRFFLPSEYTMESAPVPKDSRVDIVRIHPQRLAVLKIKGGLSRSVYEEKRAELLARLRDSEWRPAGEPTGYVYDPPFTIWSLRRSEIVVPVEPRDLVKP